MKRDIIYNSGYVQEFKWVTSSQARSELRSKQNSEPLALSVSLKH